MQRPADNRRVDIGFEVGTDRLDVAALTVFLGDTQGWVCALYAQDGSVNDVSPPLPLSTSSMPTISVSDPTGVRIDGYLQPTARNVEQPYQPVQGSLRYFVLPPSVSVNRASMSAFLSLSLDHSGSGSGCPFMSLFEVGDPKVAAADVYVTGWWGTGADD